MLGLTVLKEEICHMGHLPQKVHLRYQQFVHSATKPQDHCAIYCVIISPVVFTTEQQRKNTRPSEKYAPSACLTSQGKSQELL